MFTRRNYLVPSTSNLYISTIIVELKLPLLNHTLSIWLQTQFSQRYRQIKDRRPNFFGIFLAWHDRETRGVQELILSLFKVDSWLTYGLKSVRFWWYIHTFHENGDGFLLKIRLEKPIKTILEAHLFMYLLTNTNIAGIKKKCYDPTCCCLADYWHGVSKVWCKWLEDKNMIFATLY